MRGNAMSWLSQFLTPAWVILLGAVIATTGAAIAAGGAFWASHRQSDVYRQLAAKNEELAAKSDEIARLTKDSLAAITGGDSFCRVNLLGRDDAQGPTVVVIHQGRYPLYEVAVRFADLRRWGQPLPPGMTAAQLLATDPQFHPGTLAPTSASQVGRVPALRDDAEGFNVFFSARNGFWMQKVRLRRVAGAWVMATRVVRDGGQPTEAVIFEKVDNGFPANAGGHVDW